MVKMVKQSPEFSIKRLDLSDISPGLLDTFAHSQKTTKIWIKKDGNWALTDVSILREWSPEKRIWISEYMSQQIHRSNGLEPGKGTEHQEDPECLDSKLIVKTLF